MVWAQGSLVTVVALSPLLLWPGAPGLPVLSLGLTPVLPIARPRDQQWTLQQQEVPVPSLTANGQGYCHGCGWARSMWPWLPEEGPQMSTELELRVGEPLGSA